LGISDEVTARPQAVLALLEAVGLFAPVDDVVFVGLFENPLVQYATRKSWTQVEALAKAGLDLTEHSLARVKCDYEKALHQRLAMVHEADSVADSASDVAAVRGGDPEFLDFIDEADRMGYKVIPGLSRLLVGAKAARNQAEQRARQLEMIQAQYQELAESIEHFGRKKQRHLKRMVRKHNLDRNQ
jgi:hypothetical protein